MEQNARLARRIERSFTAQVERTVKAVTRMTEPERLRAMQVICNMDDAEAFCSVASHAFVARTSL